MLKIQQNYAQAKNLEEIGHHIKINHYSSAYNLCRMVEKQIMNRSKIEFSPSLLLNRYSKKQVEQSLQLLEVQSLKSYCLMNLNQFDEARQILEKCLRIFPNHTSSLRRLASLNQKEGNLQESLNIFQKMAMYEPDNVHLSHSIIKLNKKLKCLSNTSSIQKIQISKTTFEEEANGSENKQHVTFGTSEIIEITSDHSDQYFAHIKQEINKLSQKKPKKSILKGSKVNKDSMSIPTYTHSEEEEKPQLDQLMVKKTLSMKSCSTESPLKWESDSLQDEKLINNAKKQKKKKKCVSFSVGKDIPQDKQ